MNSIASTSEFNLQELFPFELDEFQKQAIAALSAGKSVVICAPTGSGKTLIGEYAIYRALNHGKRVFYTTPLKALSNQKFRDFQEQFGEGNAKRIGLLTGDTIINPNADVVIMTTEIFRNMLYETPIGQLGTSLEDVEAVVLDECHYISNRYRGTVWEESIIYCPPQIQLVALSATIGNPQELTDWIAKVRNSNSDRDRTYECELINSDFRPVPLRYYFCDRKGIHRLLNQDETQISPKLKASSPRKGQKAKRLKVKDCPKIYQVVQQLQAKDMLPAIYIIFSRRGCDKAVDTIDALDLVTQEEGLKIESILLYFFLSNNMELQNALLEHFSDSNAKLADLLRNYLANNDHGETHLANYLTTNPNQKYLLWQFLCDRSQIGRIDQIEPLMRGIASHHAGLLPAWKELVERLFELGLVKVVFATATLAAGINMPARTTIMSALSKRTDGGHSMLSPSEFLQISGRAGRRGKDKVGHVVTIQTPFEGAKEAAFLATSSAEPLRSWFTPSYGMVLNLLQKYSLSEVKELLERSFAEYLSQKRLAPEQTAIAEITTDLAKLDVALAAVSPGQLASYQKLKERAKEEQRLLEILQQQAEVTRKNQIKPLISQIEPGRIVGLKGKHIRVNSPLAAVLVEKIPGSGKASDLLCLGADNYWYIAANADISEINQGTFSQLEIADLEIPALDNLKLGKWRKGDEATAIAIKQIANYLIPPVPPQEITEQQQRLDEVNKQIDEHPVQQVNNPNRLLKKHNKRLQLREKLHKTQIKYQKQKSNQSYYWSEFLNLISVLQEFDALDEYNPTFLGQAAATIRGDNELWLALIFVSGELEYLEPHHLAATVCALITETPRADVWCDFPPPKEVLEVLGVKKRGAEAEDSNNSFSIREIRTRLFQVQRRHGVGLPVWREYELVGLCEQWALGMDWNELCESVSLAEGDIVRMLRRTVDVLSQIPQIPNISSTLSNNARDAGAMMKRFPI
ncbi:DEAD/DEAH box helicase [Waterburya agarophytonicola K14]|uniref:DEAD/DEAH box helicase n=1 Tax=Waterburya agarophytonicola KI4 TaxID=2874699 RepID=A0A964BQ96_9CYAN|nr:DEAD/DEAH box helicase [Waterburya agarophytonicola KI4]